MSLTDKKKRGLFAKLSSHDMIGRSGGGGGGSMGGERGVVGGRSPPPSSSSSSSSSSTPLPHFSESDLRYRTPPSSSLPSPPHQSSPRLSPNLSLISFEATTRDKVLLSYFKTFLGENDNSKPLTLLEFSTAVTTLDGLPSWELTRRGGEMERIYNQFLKPK